MNDTNNAKPINNAAPIAPEPFATRRVMVICPDCQGDGNIHEGAGRTVKPCSNCDQSGHITFRVKPE